MNRQAFTLIELLVVVAIIAILAAVAVPNFLDAQIRAKVSRVHSDQRVIAMGLEAYRADEGSLPDPLPQTSAIFDFEERLRALTTPVAYLTTVPRDVFVRQFDAGRGVVVNLEQERGSLSLLYGRGDKAGSRGAIDLGSQFMMIASSGPDGVLSQIHYYPPLAAFSGGAADCPICSPELASILSVVVYDPTNGAISAGDIYRWSSATHVHGRD